VSDALVDRAAQTDASQPLVLRTLVHDLRQPVMAIGLLVELLGDIEDLTDDVKAHVQQLGLESRWIADLLSISDSDGQTGSVEQSPTAGVQVSRPYPGRCDASSAARAAVRSAKSSYRGVVLLSAPAPAVVTGHQTALRRAISNLVENAMRAAGPRGNVRVDVDRDHEGGVQVVVEDDGPGFGRVQMGNRLGLTVVAQAVISSGGTLEIGASELGGVRVVLHLKEADRGHGGPGA
jgi:signal transduction histidine kinase